MGLRPVQSLRHMIRSELAVRARARKNFLLAMVPIGIFLNPAIALSEAPCMTPGTKQANIRLVKRFYEAFNNHSKGLLDSVLSPKWVDVPTSPGQEPGREGMKKMMDAFDAVFRDFYTKNEDFIVSGDKVVVRSTATGTQRGTLFGVPPKNQVISIDTVDIHQICAGRIVRTWHVENWLSVLFQIGLLPAKETQ